MAGATFSFCAAFLQIGVPSFCAVSAVQSITVYPFIYERVNRYKSYNRYMLLTYSVPCGKITVFRKLYLRSQNRLDTPV